MIDFLLDSNHTSNNDEQRTRSIDNNHHHHHHHQEEQNRSTDERSVGLNEVQKAMISNMLKENMISTISKPQLPSFFKDKPELWFILIEAEFQATKTSNDDMKYYSVIRALDTDTLQQITDILHEPPVIEKYKKIKEALIKRTSVSREKRIHKLLTQMDLGDKKPTQLLREMRELAGDSIQEELLQQLWLDRMPNQIKPLLVVSSNLSLNALAEVADKVVDASRSSIIILATKPTNVYHLVHLSHVNRETK